MGIFKIIADLLKKSDEVNTINSETKEFLEENGASALLKLIDNDRAYGTKSVNNGNVVKEPLPTYNSRNGSEITYVLRRVGSQEISSPI